MELLFIKELGHQRGDQYRMEWAIFSGMERNNNLKATNESPLNVPFQSRVSDQGRGGGSNSETSPITVDIT